MSNDKQGPLDIAAKAEQDLNLPAAKTGTSDSPLSSKCSLFPKVQAVLLSSFWSFAAILT